ncbi:uncharacterized protein LOC128227563 [Mya arenaria]|uniref:uncharacterized protein LOC128227563 n=1 Tax=Mya arenaria TaxID=6604 RepID=UPI0022E60ED3|nr:uncharacterized protein LOC128227563 [Mya arenaria]
MVDYHRWMTRKENERRARISKQTLMENETMLGRWLHENQPCNDDYFLEERSENFDLYQNEIYEIQHENNSLHTEKYHLTQDMKNKETQLKLMQQDCKIFRDDMEKKNGHLLIKNADLVKANKKLKKQLNRFKFDFKDQLDKHDKLLQHLNDEVSERENKEYLLTKKQKENKYLKNEISRLNALDSRFRNRTNQTKRVEGRNQTLQHEIIDLKLERAALRKELNTLNRRCDRMSKGLERSDTSVHTHETGGINSPKTTHKKKSPQPEHNKEDELSRSRLKQQLILCHHEQSLILEKNQEQEDKIALLKEENKKLVQDNQNERSHHKEMTVHLNHEKEKWTQEKQAHYLMIHELELRIKQAEGNLCLAYEELNNEKSRNAKLSQEKTQYTNTKIKNELESEKKKETQKILRKN